MTARDRLLVTGLALVAVLGGFWFLVLGPKRAESSRLHAEVAAARVTLADTARQTVAASAARRSFGADTAAVAALGKALPADDQTASLLYQLDAAAGRSRVTLKSVSPGTPAPGSSATALPAGVTEVVLSLSFSGRYADLQRFLGRVHDSTVVRGDVIRVRGRLLDVKGVQLTGSGGRVEATVSASAYIAAAATPGATAPGGAPAGATASAAAPPAAGATTPAPAGSAAPPTQPAMVGAAG